LVDNFIKFIQLVDFFIDRSGTSHIFLSIEEKPRAFDRFFRDQIWLIPGGRVFMEGFNPERLKEIRIVKNMTLEQLADRIGVTKQAVSKYERGLSIPSPKVIEKILISLQIPRKYLNKGSISPAGTNSALFFRTSKSTKRIEKDFADIQSRWGYESLWGIRSFEPLPSMNLPVFAPGQDIPGKASLLRNHWGIGTAPVENLTALLEKNGIFTFIIDTSKFHIDAYSRIINGIPVIVLNKNRGTPVRRRFSLAHELGHLVLHQSLSEAEFEANNEKIEAQANLFAGCFLLPEESFGRSVIAPKLEHFISLKKEWKVSISAMIYRCKDLGVLESRKITKLFRQIAKKKWQSFEPLDDEIESEEPLYLLKQAQKHLIDRNSIEKFIDATRLPLPDMEKLCFLPKNFFSEYDEANLHPEEYGQLSLFE
jgi:Zn-dependent peptidase ImmA (M78 family)/transcriptional regulator with XRE-family HTH domain